MAKSGVPFGVGRGGYPGDDNNLDWGQWNLQTGNPVAKVLELRRINKSKVLKRNEFVREESIFYQVRLDRIIMNSAEIEIGPAIPKYGTVMPGNDTMFLIAYSANMDQIAPQVYEVEAIYSNVRLTAEISMGTYRTRESFDFDLDGVPFTTTAGEPITHEEEVGRKFFSVVKNMKTIPGMFFAKSDYINSDTVTLYGNTYEPKTLWLTDVAIAPADLGYATLSFRIYHREETWLVKKRNVGYCCLLRITTPISFTSGGGTQITGTDVKMVYTQIKVGNPAMYTKVPLPLRNTPNDLTTHGTLFPQYLALDDKTGRPFTDPDKVQIKPDEIKKMFKEATLTFRTKNLIKFTNNVPLS